MSRILTTKQQTELKEILPDVKEEIFVKKAIDSAIKSYKAMVFFDISEKVRTGLVKHDYSPEKLLTEFKD